MADDLALEIESSGGSEDSDAEIASTSFGGSGHDSPDLDDRDLTRLHRACKDHNYEEVHKLLCNDASIFATDNDGCTPLHCACEGGDKRIVELLIQKSADNLKVPISDDPYVKSKIKQFINCTDYNERTPLDFACTERHTEIVELLLELGANVNVTDYSGDTPLGNACMKGHTEVVKMLLKQDGVDINHTNNNQRTPLGIACVEGHTEVIKLLLEHGADVNVVDNNGNTPLGNASIPGHTQTVELLLKQKGVEINHINKQNRTPLGIACVEGYTEVIKLLLEHGAKVNVADINEHTPLGIACIEGHTEIVKLLLEQDGVDVNHTDNDNDTPLSCACITGHAKVVELLLKQKDTDVTKCNKYSNNALNAAVVLGQRDAAMAIVKSDKWKDALHNYTDEDTSDDGGIIRRILSCFKRLRNDDSNDSDDDANKSVTQFKTPMRVIIEKMPDVAKVVFDRCCETEKSPYDRDYEITYNYEFLEDFDLDRRTLEDAPSDSTRQNLNEDKNKSSDVKKSNEKWPPKSKYSSHNHCLNILANSPSADLLKHPLAATLLDQKWNKYGRLVYYTNLFFYFLFVILLTSFALTVSPPNSNICMEVFGNDLGNDNDNETAAIHCSEGRFVYVSVARVFVIVYSVIMLLRELAQAIQFRLEYLTGFVNYIEVSLFIFTIMFASVRSNQCYCTRSWQWQFGVFAVFLSWIALIISIRKLPVVGIYVVMFIKIFNNFIKVVILALLLISAFVFPLYMMFFDPQDRAEGIRTPFITPWRTIIKTITMTMGNFDMDSLLRQDNQMNAPGIQYPAVSFSLIIVFVILMPILFLNLLTSLAVGDTDEIRRSADAYRRTLRVEFTLPVEEFLRSIKRQLPKKLEKVESWIESLITCQQKQKIKPNEKKKGITRAISTIQGYFKTEPEESVDEVKNKSKPLSEEMKDLHSAVSQEVKDLRSSVSEEVKDLRSSMDQLLAIVKSMNERQGGGGGVEEAEGGGGGLEEAGGGIEEQ